MKKNVKGLVDIIIFNEDGEKIAELKDQKFNASDEKTEQEQKEDWLSDQGYSINQFGHWERIYKGTRIWFGKGEIKAKPLDYIKKRHEFFVKLIDKP